MKKSLLVVLLFSVMVYADLSIEQIQQMITKIHQKREGVGLETLEKTKEPFVKLQLQLHEKNNITTSPVQNGIKAEEPKLALHAIMNSKAYINDSWKSVEDDVMGYTLKYIGKKGVVLRNGSIIKKLFLHKKRDNLILFEEKE